MKVESQRSVAGAIRLLWLVDVDVDVIMIMWWRREEKRREG